MRARELKAAQKRLGLSQEGLAAALDIRNPGGQAPKIGLRPARADPVT